VGFPPFSPRSRKFQRCCRCFFFSFPSWGGFPSFCWRPRHNIVDVPFFSSFFPSGSTRFKLPPIPSLPALPSSLSLLFASAQRRWQQSQRELVSSLADYREGIDLSLSSFLPFCPVFLTPPSFFLRPLRAKKNSRWLRFPLPLPPEFKPMGSSLRDLLLFLLIVPL